MIYTSSHKNYNSNIYVTIAISGNRGKDANYQGWSYPKLAPRLSFWQIWHNNKGIISDEENDKYYIEEYYKQVLSILDPEDIYRSLDNSILLCYEDNSEFCHRHIVAAWLELLLNIKVPEVKVEDCILKEFNRPEWIKDYLEEVIRKERNMRGFNSVRALYLFEKAEKFDQIANQLEDQGNEDYSYYRQTACFLRCDADEAEAEYKSNKLIRTNDTKKE